MVVKTEKPCRTCGTIFRMFRTTDKYCSPQCAKGKLKPLTAKVDMKLVVWSKEVRQRDGHICKRCAATKNLHAHHMAKRSTHTSLKYDVSNGITVCSFCHAWIHANPAQAARDGYLILHKTNGSDDKPTFTVE